MTAIEVLKNIHSILTPGEKKKLYILLGAVIVMASLEVSVVASVTPFLSAASDPSSIHNTWYLQYAYEKLSFSSDQAFLAGLGIFVLTVLALSNTFIVLTKWAMQRFVWGRNHTISVRLLRSYITSPYEFLNSNDSNDLIKNILQETKEITSEMLRPAIQGIAKSIVVLAITAFLIAYDPIVSLISFSVIGISYYTIYTIVKKKLSKTGKRRVKTNSRRYRYVKEALNSAQILKVFKKEEEFIDNYEEPSYSYGRAQASFRVIKSVPKYVLEVVAIGGVLCIAIYLILQGGKFQTIVPTLGVYTFAGYRLMPAFQQAFRGFASLEYNEKALQIIKRHIRMSPDRTYSGSEIDRGIKAIKLDDVSYRYAASDTATLRNVSLKIKQNEITGVVGKTGAGKSTLIHVLCGLLRPTSGNIKAVTGGKFDTVNDLLKLPITLVPQQVRLINASMYSNITLSRCGDAVDKERAIACAKTAGIHSYICQLPDGYDSTVGESGSGLSGGQRQRVGIARALYPKPSVVILDEATRSLDPATEKRVLDNLSNIEGLDMVIMITHDDLSLSFADKIVVLDNGRVTNVKNNQGKSDKKVSVLIK
jgi:ATP-binding cassette subfamily C protein